MSQADPSLPQLHPDSPDPADAAGAEQARFDALVREVASWRAALGEWNDRIARYHQALDPIRHELGAAWRQWVLALDEAALQPGLSRGERQQLGEWIEEAARPLLAMQHDPELAAILARHAPPASETRAPAEDGSRDDETLLDSAEDDWEWQAAAAEALRAERAAQRREAAAAKRRGQPGHGASPQAQTDSPQTPAQSVREVYRRLASLLHPDREQDASRREHKTALMQQANRAYAEDNLLGLLELQWQAGPVDAARRTAADAQRLRHQVSALQAQSAQLQAEVRRLEAGFREATGLAPGWGLQARKADRLISSQAQELRGALASLRRQTLLVADTDLLKTWLREQRRADRA